MPHPETTCRVYGLCGRGVAGDANDFFAGNFIDPESGVRMPTMFFSKTDLPVPEAPMMTRDSPSRISRSSSVRT